MPKPTPESLLRGWIADVNAEIKDLEAQRGGFDPDHRLAHIEYLGRIHGLTYTRAYYQRILGEIKAGRR